MSEAGALCLADSAVIRLHASCASRDGAAVLLVGPSGCGKSDLLLRLLDAGFDLVADDRVDLVGARVQAPASLAGLIEVRGVGVFRLSFVREATLHIVVHLGPERAERLPPSGARELGVPMLAVDPLAVSAVSRIRMALAAAVGSVGQLAGFLES